MNSNAFCDPETGLCTPAQMETGKTEICYREDVEIIYVGDPMCSWCWGISPGLNQLRITAQKEDIPYRIVVGGLRPGGGDEWNEQFKNFLRHHWEEVNQRSGQPFGYKLFEEDNFNYDTEPACRAVVAARTISPEKEARFFELTQHYFYVRNEDPKRVDFYRPICKELGLDFERFSQLFASDEMKAATRNDFALNRQWGVKGYPTVIVRKGDQLSVIARGFASFDEMWARVKAIVPETTE